MYRILGWNGTVQPSSTRDNGPEIGDLEYGKNGGVTPVKRGDLEAHKTTVFPIKGHRFSSQSPPKTGDGTIKEPSGEPSGAREQGRDDLFAEPAPQPVTKPKTEKRARTRTRIPEDWWPDAAGIAFAAERSVNPHVEVQQFRDYHTARGNLMADGPACWRTWCQNQVKFGRTARPGNMPDRNRPAQPDRGLAAMAAIAGCDITDGADGFPSIDHDDNAESWRETLP